MSVEESAAAEGAAVVAMPPLTTEGDAVETTLTKPKQNGGGPPGRVCLTSEQLEAASKEELITNWKEQDAYLDLLESQATSQEGELTKLREITDRIKQQHSELQLKEKVMMRRLASKEQEIHDFASQLAELRAAQVPTAAALRSSLLDPAATLLVQKLRQELSATKTRLEETQNELSAWKFTPDSNTGKRLMAKCRLLYQENEELGRVIASGRLAKLEGELALQKSFSDEVKKSQSELDEFLQELDEDVEGMQGTIYFLQQQLKMAKEAVATLSKENLALRQLAGTPQTENGDAKEGSWAEEEEEETRDSGQAEEETDPVMEGTDEPEEEEEPMETDDNLMEEQLEKEPEEEQVVKVPAAEEALTKPAEVESPAVTTPVKETPAVVDPSVVASDVVEPSVVAPAAVEPSVVASDVVEPSVVAPAAVEPSVVAPAAVEPALAAPAKEAEPESDDGPASKRPCLEQVETAAAEPAVEPAEVAAVPEQPKQAEQEGTGEPAAQEAAQ